MNRGWELRVRILVIVALGATLCACTGDRITKGMSGLHGQPTAAALVKKALGRV